MNESLSCYSIDCYFFNRGAIQIPMFNSNGILAAQPRINTTGKLRLTLNSLIAGWKSIIESGRLLG